MVWSTVFTALATFATLLLALIYVPNYPEKIPHRWEFKMFLLLGMKWEQYLGYTFKHGVDVTFYHRWAYGLYLAFMNTFFYSPATQLEYPDKLVSACVIQNDPVFIIGHFRSGTTLLHELMDMDENVTCPNTIVCFNPHLFAKQAEWIAKYGKYKISRPMDKVRVSMSSPFEDEFAIANMCGLSPYLGAVFVNTDNAYDKYISLKECSDEERDTWKQTAQLFFKRCLYKHQEKRLVLKSPYHTARIKIILEMYPNAKFVHISRHPYDIYQSMDNLHRTLLTQWYLQRPDWSRATEMICNKIVTNFKIMYDSYFEDLHLIPEGNFISCSFKELVESPSSTLEKIYTGLDLPDYDKLKPKLLEYEETKQKTFKMNSFDKVPADVKKRVQAEWSRYFEVFGYDK